MENLPSYMVHVDVEDYLSEAGVQLTMPHATLVREDRERAVLIFDNVVCKIQRLRCGGRVIKGNTLENEWSIPSAARHLAFTPEPLHFFVSQGFQIIVTTRCQGVPADALDFKLIEILKFIAMAAMRLLTLSCSGIVHGDLAPHNFIISGTGGGVSLIDFEHARRASVVSCLYYNFFRRRHAASLYNVPFTVTVVRLFEVWLPPARKAYIRLLGLKR